MNTNNSFGIQMSACLNFRRWIVRCAAVVALAIIVLAGALVFDGQTSVAHAGCASYDNGLQGVWYNEEELIPDGNPGVLSEFGIFFTCDDAYTAYLLYSCDNAGYCVAEDIPLYVGGDGDYASLSHRFRRGKLFLDAWLVPGRYDERRLAITWDMDYLPGSGRADYVRTEYFVHERDAEYFADAYADDHEEPAAPPSAPAPAAAPAAVPNFQTTSPAPGSCIKNGAQFEWIDRVGLPANRVYEIIVWQDGQDPMRDGRGITKADTRTSRSLDLDYLDDQRDWFGPGVYNWAVIEISANPYQRHRILGQGGTFRYVRGQNCE